jgi:type I restriction enzyme S subunit
MGDIIKVPIIRFPEFKNTWEHKRLNELLSEAKKRNEDLKYDKDEVLSVSGELGIVNQIEHLGRSYAGVSVHQYHVVEIGDIVYTKSPLKANPFGIIKLNKGKAGIVSTLYAVYKVNLKTAFGPFLDYYFSLDANTNRYLRPLVKKGAKNDMKISNAYVLHDRIYSPSLKEQTRIASFFTVLDKKISELRQKKTLLEQYKKGIMQKIFSQELRFKDLEGKEFPKWEKLSFGELYSFKTTNSLSRDKFNYEIGSVKNIHYGDIHTKFKTLFDITNEVVPFINSDIKLDRIDKDNYCQIGDLVIADASEDYSDIGKAIEVINLQNEKILAGLHTLLARPDKKKISIGFGGYLMCIDYVQMQIRKIAQGTKVLGLSAKRLSDIIINLPSKSEQIKIVGFITVLNEKIYRTENQIQQTQVYKKGLLQNMFC